MNLLRIFESEQKREAREYMERVRKESYQPKLEHASVHLDGNYLTLEFIQALKNTSAGTGMYVGAMEFTVEDDKNGGVNAVVKGPQFYKGVHKIKAILPDGFRTDYLNVYRIKCMIYYQRKVIFEVMTKDGNWDIIAESDL